MKCTEKAANRLLEFHVHLYIAKNEALSSYNLQAKTKRGKSIDSRLDLEHFLEEFKMK